MNLWLYFLTGLTVGGLSCLAVQGGLLASVVAARDQESGRKFSKVWPIVAFLVAKLFVYTLIGFLLGIFGKTLEISDSVRSFVQLLAGLYMIAVALDMLHVHPIFRYVIIQPPQFLTRMVRSQAHSRDLFAPALLGIMTIFIPCGTTLAVEAAVLASGNPAYGAAALALFTLGTFPLFFSLGYLTSSLAESFRQKFFKVAAFLVLYLGVISINGFLNLVGSPVTLESIYKALPIEINLAGTAQPGGDVVVQNGVQVASIGVYGAGYKPNSLTVKAGLPVHLNLTTYGELGCTSIFKIPALGITKALPTQGTDFVEFTPTSKGQLTWTCSMGMYRGVMNVI